MTTEFREAIESTGLLPPADLVAGKWVRFPGIGKKASNKAGFAFLFEDGLGGIFGDYSQGIKKVWQAHKVKSYLSEDRADFDAMVREQRARADTEQAEEWEEASVKAQRMFTGLGDTPPDPNHPYLKSKGVKSHGLRAFKDKLLMPIMDTRGAVMTYQTIDGDGKKMLMTGGKKKGCAFIIKGDKSKVYVVEGYSTGATVHEATGNMVVVAVDAGNLMPVAEVLIEKGYRDIVIAADNDADSDTNVGIEKARAVAEVFAEVTYQAPPESGDWNDYATKHGLDRIKALLAPPRTRSITAERLIGEHFQPLKWAVPGIIPEGLTILAGRPKFGKSWLMMGLAYAVATGGLAWNFAATNKASVHALFLEDSHRRLQSRMQHMEGYFDTFPDNLHFYVNFPRIGEGFAEELDVILERDPSCGLIIIDTLQKIRPKSGGGARHIYQADYEDYEQLQRWSIQNGVPVICIHHTRKGEAGQATNPFDEISGSTGLQGVADTLIVVCRDKDEDIGKMYVTGREVSEETYPIEFDYSNMTWTVMPPEGSTYDPTESELKTWWKDGHEAITVKEATGVWKASQRVARTRLDDLVEAGDLCKRNQEGEGKGRRTVEYYRSPQAKYKEESGVITEPIEPDKDPTKPEVFGW
jgi:putative DNA primase/helicase